MMNRSPNHGLQPRAQRKKNKLSNPASALLNATSVYRCIATARAVDARQPLSIPFLCVGCKVAQSLWTEAVGVAFHPYPLTGLVVGSIYLLDCTSTVCWLHNYQWWQIQPAKCLWTTTDQTRGYHSGPGHLTTIVRVHLVSEFRHMKHDGSLWKGHQPTVVCKTYDFYVCA